MARVLIVLDGEFRFSVGTAGYPDFTYAALVDALASAGHVITKAHRGTDASPGVTQSFHFQIPDLLNYDVIWLIGHDGRNDAPPSTGSSGAGIDATEIAAIATFMEAGGGVFATGDHDSIGSVMCGRIPRVRAMRSWFGEGDTAPNIPADVPRNFPRQTAGRADTTQRSPDSNYGGDANLVWFENQSDRRPQPITPTPAAPAHPILRRGGADIVVYPDHMHEGRTLGEPDLMSYHFDQTLMFAGQSFVEFPQLPGELREVPHVIATGQSLAHTSSYAYTNTVVDSAQAGPKPVNTLSVYEGRNAGVGRIVTGSTFHHYVDINLTGDTNINNATHPGSETRAGADARKGHGFNDDAATFDQIKAVYDNITKWLARPRPAIQLILERSTFSHDEAVSNANFPAAILVVVDGLKPTQFPGGGVTSLNPASFQEAWAPTITPATGTGLEIRATSVNSDDPGLHDRLQRLTFTYRVHFTDVAAAFTFPDPVFEHRTVNASLTSAAVSGPLTDSAQITLVKGANPFMRDLVPPNETAWLSSDVKVFPVIAGAPGSGLVDEASHQQAIDYLVGRLSTMTDGEFNGLTGDQEGSALSPIPRTTGMPHRKVYNFAIARVRLNQAPMGTTGLRVFFRIVPSPTTASLTYHQTAMGVPLGSYLETGGGSTIALPGQNAAGTQWLSFPCFLHTRMWPPETQTDGLNVKDFVGPITSETSMFFGAVLDTNLDDENYLPLVPPATTGTRVPLSARLMAEHQCIVAQIRYPGAPIPDGATPFTSDKLSQRNLAIHSIANPGLDASRMALHTFEIEATPNAVGEGSPPDELLLQWHRVPPEGSEVRLEIPSWDAAAVVELADRFYPRHEIRAFDAHTIAVPGGGVRYLPIPPSNMRQTGVMTVHFPLGVRKKQRFDVSVHQVTTRGRQVIVPPKSTNISREEAAKLLKVQGGVNALPRGVFDLGDNKILITDLAVFDDRGDHAIVVEHPEPAVVERAQQQSGQWRETTGAFQLGIPVSTREEMLPYYLRLLSVMRWRAEWLRPNDRWYKTFHRYVELLAEKVRALGGDPYSVPPTPGGDIPLPGKCEDDDTGCLGCLGGIFLCLRRLIRRNKTA